MDFADGTFTRPSVATFHVGLPSYFAGELLTRYGVDVARFRPGGGIYMEGARTNAESNSAAIVGTANGSVVADNATAPDGSTVDADTFTAQAAGESSSLVQEGSSAFADSVDVAASIFCKRSGAWEAPFPNAFGRNKASVVTNASAFADVSGWQRGSAVFDAGVGISQVRAGYTQGATSGVWVAEGWGGQLEEGSFASSLIETAGAAATRAGDRLTMPEANIDPAFFTSPWEMRVVMTQSRAEQIAHGQTATFVQSGTGSLDLVGVAANGDVDCYFGGGISKVSGATWEAGDIISVRVNPANGDLRVITPTQDLFDSTAAGGGWTPNDFAIGTDHGGVGPHFGTVYPPVAISAV